jgi:hypothetical protein
VAIHPPRGQFFSTREAPADQKNSSTPNLGQGKKRRSEKFREFPKYHIKQGARRKCRVLGTVGLKGRRKLLQENKAPKRGNYTSEGEPKTTRQLNNAKACKAMFLSYANRSFAAHEVSNLLACNA